MNNSNTKTAVVIVPTYNEEDVIEILLHELLDVHFPIIENWNMHLLIIDGNSKDKTGTIILNKVNNYDKRFSINTYNSSFYFPTTCYCSI